MVGLLPFFSTFYAGRGKIEDELSGIMIAALLRPYPFAILSFAVSLQNPPTLKPGRNCRMAF